MSEWVWAKIEIGGTISRPQLTRMVKEFGLPAPSRATRFLALEDSQARYGQFETLEAYLVEQAIPFDRTSDGTYEHSPEVRKFRPGRIGNASPQPTTDRVAFCDREDQPVVAVADVVGLIAETRTRKELAARLTELCGLDVPDLPSFSVTETF